MKKAHVDFGIPKLVIKKDLAIVVVYENALLQTTVLEYDSNSIHCECVISRVDKKVTNN